MGKYGSLHPLLCYSCKSLSVGSEVHSPESWVDFLLSQIPLQVETHSQKYDLTLKIQVMHIIIYGWCSGLELLCSFLPSALCQSGDYSPLHTRDSRCCSAAGHTMWQQVSRLLWLIEELRNLSNPTGNKCQPPTHSLETKTVLMLKNVLL